MINVHHSFCQKLLVDRSNYPDIHYIGIDRPGRMRPDAVRNLFFRTISVSDSFISARNWRLSAYHGGSRRHGRVDTLYLAVYNQGDTFIILTDIHYCYYQQDYLFDTSGV